MNIYQITDIIYIHIGMNEWVKRYAWEFPHKTQRQMNHATHHSVTYYEHIMSQWSSRTSDQFIWLVSEKKTEAVNASLIKNTKGERGGRGRGERAHVHYFVVIDQKSSCILLKLVSFCSVCVSFRRESFLCPCHVSARALSVSLYSRVTCLETVIFCHW